MDESNVSHNILSAVGGRVACTHMYTLRQSSYQTLVFGRRRRRRSIGVLVLESTSWVSSGNVQVHVLLRKGPESTPTHQKALKVS